MTSFFRPLLSSCLLLSGIRYLQADQVTTAAFYPDQPACKVKSVEKYPAEYENVAASPTSNLLAFTQLDKSGIYQVYISNTGSKDSKCITCTPGLGAPRQDRNKPMLSWHPSGNWLFVGVEETTHDLMWMPPSWQRGFLQSGIWLNMWITTPTGDRWYQMTDFKNDGFVGTSFTPDGRKAVWAEIYDGNIFVNRFGKWKLFIADFSVGAEGAPLLLNRKDITPAGARWIEPGNFSPDGKSILLSADIGMIDAQGQDQWTLNIETGKLQNLTSSPTVWDEHGLYSPDGSKVSFMSSYPFRQDPRNNQVIFLKTEFMIMDADGGHLQQVTHFNTKGFPESQSGNTIAAVAGFMPGGSQMFGTVMAPNFGKTNWMITFAGRCGARE